jgi:hypothetical protein
MHPLLHRSPPTPIYTASTSTHLLDLLGFLRFLSLTSSLRSLRSRLSIHTIIPPSETTRVVTDEALVVNIVVLRSSPEWQEVVQAPREFVTAVRINSLEQTANNPNVHSQDVQLAGNQNPQDGNTDCASTEEHDFDWRSIFGSETKRRRVLVVDLVDALVQRTPMERAMKPIMPSILEHEKDADMEKHSRPGREGHASFHSAVFGHGVKEPDLRELDGEVREEDEFRAVPLFGGGGDLLPLNFVLVEVGDLADDDPGDAAAEVNHFVHHERHDSGGEDIVLHVRVVALVVWC